MWVWHACLSSVLTAKAPCNPTSWADIAELVAFFALAAVVAVLAVAGLLCAMEWLDSLF